MPPTIVTITDVTRMHNQRVCIAGYTEEGICIRPIFRYGGIYENWLYHNNQVIIRPFQPIELVLLEHIPHPPHTEDWIMDNNHRIAQNFLPESQQQNLLNNTLSQDVNEIFGVKPHYVEHEGCFLIQGEGHHSLGTIRPYRITGLTYQQQENSWDYRISFQDKSRCTYRLKIVDLTMRYYLDYIRTTLHREAGLTAAGILEQLQQRTTYLRIGLARGWEKYPDRCYLQVTGIYTFPDLYEGNCFADFQ